MNKTYPFLLLALAAAVLLYAAGLSGPFLFDDSVHITQNRWVKIDNLEWAELVRAWHSSPSPFPTDRPLAQLSFGINHALAGLEPWAFKATNLGLHLLGGLLIYVLVRLAHRALHPQSADSREGQWLALATTALWLIHPLHVSTVLYTVQRMAQISTLGMLAALACYFYGRTRIAEGRTGIPWMLAAAPLAALGFIGKENAALLPLLLLVGELTVLNRVGLGPRPIRVRAIQVLFIALPLAAALAYFATHPGYFDHSGRNFSLEERLLTQPRVLRFYIQMLLVPDVSRMGLFHDDLVISTGLTDPPSTLIAIVALGLLAVAALALRNRAPLPAFGVLLFLAGHALESTAFPLEMVFEHRNYLPSVGILLVVAWLLVQGARRLRHGRLAPLFGVVLLLAYSAATWVRVGEWSSQESFILSAAENHPRSPRANFMAGQLLISALDRPGVDREAVAQAAQTFLQGGLDADPRCINCLFGLLVLDLHLDRQPDPALVGQLAAALRSGHVDATNASVSQFSYLVRWHRSDGVKLAPEQLRGIFEAALANPGWNNTGRAGIASSYREYFELVAGDLEAALVQAHLAVRSWPEQWSYHMQLIEVLRKLGRDPEALAALDRATPLAENATQLERMAQVRAALAQSE